MRKFLHTLMVALLLPLTACDKLENGTAINEALPGKWSFSYTTSEEIDFSLSYEFLLFNADGTCAITYPDGQIEGRYRASDAVIRIEAALDNGKEDTYLWRVLSMSPYRIVTEYDYEESESHKITLTLTLDKVH